MFNVGEFLCECGIPPGIEQLSKDSCVKVKWPWVNWPCVIGSTLLAGMGHGCVRPIFWSSFWIYYALL